MRRLQVSAGFRGLLQGIYKRIIRDLGLRILFKGDLEGF